ncbi:MAG: hypothetical protein Q4G52_11760 [Clostridia bacterium]|nr:hypothetical protein [Clostridia bacterium]
MKKMVMILTALMTLLISAAFADTQDDWTTPREGPAVAAPENLYETVPLFDTIDDGGNVLMEYYSGAQLEVTRVIGNGMVQVQAGEPGASVMGYMREGDLRYGAAAMRSVQACVAILEISGSEPIYGYCDELSAIIGQSTPEQSYTAMGRNDKGWVQLCDTYSMTQKDAGFLLLTAEETEEPTQLSMWVVDPLPGELTAEEAYAAAIDYLLDNPGMDAVQGLPAEAQSREGLEAMHAQIRLMYDAEQGAAYWEIGMEGTDRDKLGPTVYLTPEGEPIEAFLSRG